MHQPVVPSASSGIPFPRAPQIIFTNWREALHQSGLSSGIQTLYSMAVQGYLEYCAHNAISVSIESARAYMDDVTRRGLARQPDLWKEGLNWFFRAGRQRAPAGRGAVPALSQADTGAAPWEQRLIERLRLQHYAWRTEQTYREWAWRLADFVRPRELEAVTGEDLKAFLSDLAVKGRVSRSTQKQALSALVFLFREALGREAGDLSGFQLSRRNPRVPTVLSHKECQRLFEAMDGTPRLMAELMYGSGLRLMELLRLRVKDVDLDTLAGDYSGRQRGQGPRDGAAGGLGRAAAGASGSAPGVARAGSRGGAGGGVAAGSRWSASDRERGRRGNGSGSFLRGKPRWTRTRALNAGIICWTAPFNWPCAQAARKARLNKRVTPHIAAPQFCHPFAGGRDRHPQRAGLAWAFGCGHHANLHARDEPSGPGHPEPPGCAGT